MIPIDDAAVLFTAPLEGPSVILNNKPGRNEAQLVWKEIPEHRRRGFITNYTIFYTSGTEIFGMFLSHGIRRTFVFVLPAFHTGFDCRDDSPFLCSFAAKTVPADKTSYTLTSLLGSTKYDTWIRASTIRGSFNGSNHSFTTLKYGECNIVCKMKFPQNIFIHSLLDVLSLCCLL